MPSIDYTEVKKRCKTLDLLKAHGWSPNFVTDDGLRGWCPLHSQPNGRSRSFWVRELDGWWFCHHCKTGGSVIDLALHLLAPVMLDAVRQLCRLLGQDVPYVPRSPARRSARNGERDRRGVWGAKPPDRRSG
jgi:hypothetical protein